MNGSPHKSSRLVLPKTYAQAWLVVFVSTNGREWEPLTWDDCPAWVKHPDNMARLVDGEQCSGNGETGPWYKVERVVEPKIVVTH